MIVIVCQVLNMTDRKSLCRKRSRGAVNQLLQL